MSVPAGGDITSASACLVFEAREEVENISAFPRGTERRQSSVIVYYTVMGKPKKSRNTFNYDVNKKKLKIKMKRKDNPHIECDQIRRAWDEQKTTKQNLADMGLLVGKKGILPIKTKKMLQNMEEEEPTDSHVLLKPYVIEEMEEEVSQRGNKKLTCSRDMIEYVQHMVREHNENYKAMARDEKNYYQDTPKQIKRKVELYQRCYPKEYDEFIASLHTQTST